MSFLIELTYNVADRVINSVVAPDIVSSTAQAVLSSNPYLLTGAAVVGTGIVLYASIKQGRVKTPPRDPAPTPLIAQAAERAIPVPGKRTVETPADGDRYEGEWLDEEWNGQGKFFSVDGDTYEGEFKNGKFDGKGRYKTADGEEYSGEFKNGLYDGKGFLKSADGQEYSGEFKNDLYHGKGVLKLADGEEYSGKFKEGVYDGRGILKWPDGTKYVGEFQNGQMHGYGRYDSEEISYEGEMEDGKFHGRGSMYNSIGQHYIGKFVNDNWDGYGVLEYSDGKTTYSGSFINNQKHGLGVISYSDGSTFEGEFEENQKHGAGIQIQREAGRRLTIQGFYERGNKHGKCRIISKNPFIDQLLDYNKGAVVNTNRENLKDPIFFYQLFGIDEGSGISQGYSLGIMADYLENKFQNRPEILRRVVNPLKQAAAFCEIPPDQMDQKLEEIEKGLKDGQSYLLPYGCSGHAILLNLVPTPDGQFVDCEIYNSGDGLAYNHRVDTNSGKYELMTKYRVPIEALDINVLQKISQKNDFSLVDSTYLLFSCIAGAKRIDSEHPIWKRPQKAGNCELECIFAFFAQNAPHVYKSARKDVFQDCKNAAQANRAAFRGRDVNTFPRVQHKIAKLDLH